MIRMLFRSIWILLPGTIAFLIGFSILTDVSLSHSLAEADVRIAPSPTLHPTASPTQTGAGHFGVEARRTLSSTASLSSPPSVPSSIPSSIPSSATTVSLTATTPATISPTATANSLTTTVTTTATPTAITPSEAVISISVSSHSDTVTPNPSPSAKLIPLTARKRMFEEVWRTVNENYLYPDFHGLDWEAVYQQFAPRVAETTSDESFYALLTEMVEQLGDHHSRFLAPQDAVIEKVSATGNERRVGIGVIATTTPNGALIQQVLPGSPAEKAGLRPRDRIIAVDGETCQEEECSEIEGPIGSQVRLTVIRPGEHARDIVVTRQHIQIRVTPTVRRLEGDIGYIRIPSLWVRDMSEHVSGGLTDLVIEKPINGLILDVRGNPGGWRDVLVSVLSHFVRGDVGVFFDRHSTMPLIVKQGGGPDLRHVPLVVLIDNTSSSYAEVLAAILQVETGATVIGVPSLGNTETIYAYELAGGGRLWLAQEGFRLSNGVNLEGQGVRPDITIDVDWSQFREEREKDDPHIQEALRLLSP